MIHEADGDDGYGDDHIMMTIMISMMPVIMITTQVDNDNTIMRMAMAGKS